MERQGGRAGGGREENVSGIERIASLVAGGGLLGYALFRPRASARLLALPALALLARGWGGHSALYGLAGVSTLKRGRPSEGVVLGEGAREAAGTPPAHAPIEDVVAHAGAGASPPHPTPPRSHEHDVPENELGEPGVRATPKLMDEVSTAPPPG